MRVTLICLLRKSSSRKRNSWFELITQRDRVCRATASVAEGTGRRSQAERLGYNDPSRASNLFQRLMITGFSDRVRDAPIEKRLLPELASISFAGRLRVASRRARNARCSIDCECFAVADSAC